MKVVVLVAGKGKRLRPITNKIPKPLVKIRGKEILWYIINSFAVFGYDDFVFIISNDKFGRMIKNFVEMKFSDINSSFAIQEHPFGTAHSLLVAKNYVKKDFITVYGDILFCPSVVELLLENINQKDNLIIATTVDDPTDYGCLEVFNDRLLKIHEKTTSPVSNLINTGIYYFTNKKIFDYIKRIPLSHRGEYELTDAINLMTFDYPFRVVEIANDCWIDVGTIERLLMAESVLNTWDL